MAEDSALSIATGLAAWDDTAINLASYATTRAQIETGNFQTVRGMLAMGVVQRTIGLYTLIQAGDLDVPLNHLGESEDNNVRFIALRALVKLAGNLSVLIDVFQGANNPNQKITSVRVAAAESKLEELKALRQHPEVAVRLQLVTEFSRKSQFLPAIIPMVQDADVNVRNAAIAALSTNLHLFPVGVE